MNIECTRLCSFFITNLDTVNRKQKYISAIKTIFHLIYFLYMDTRKYCIAAEIKNKKNTSVN